MTATRRDIAADEMFDGVDDLGRIGPLGDFLRACRESLLKPYDEADRQALRYQARYRRLILLAAIFTTLAVAFAAWARVSIRALPGWFEGTEAVLALASAVLVGLGLGGHWQKRWLLLRYRAERYRLLKFGILADPATWNPPGDGAWRPALEAGIRTIAELEHDDLEEEAASEQVAAVWRAGAGETLPAGTVSSLLDYYKRKRLELQITYFRRAARRGRSVWLDSLWVPAVFFLAMAAVLLRFSLRRLGLISADGWEASVLAVAPILSPALLGALRLRVTANEVARNRARSLARESALREIARRLDAADASEPSVVFGNLALAEQILSTDQHEWLRLMLEAEWFR